MNNLVDEDGLFVHSRQSSDIYDQQCFDDQSKINWIDGKEYKDHPDWSNRAQRKWHFFYRPYNYGDNIGAYQKNKIEDKAPIIQKLNDEISAHSTLKLFSIYLFPLVLMLCIYLQLWIILAVPVIAFVYFHLKAQYFKNKLRHQDDECSAFQAEINHLVDQQQEILNNRVTSDEILSMLWFDIRELESQILKKSFNDEPDRIIREVKDFYPSVSSSLGSSKWGNAPPMFPVIPSWGLLQSIGRSLSDGAQATGLKAAIKDIGDDVATFRKLSDGTPLYRLWYIQNLFFREKNIEIVSYCYDFITNRTYNKSEYTFPYNHISNISYSDDDISYMVNESLVSNLGFDEEFKENIYGCEVKVISFSSTSGSH